MPPLTRPSPSDSFLVVRLPVLKVPQPFYVALPVRDQQVKYMSLWETFHTQNTMGVVVRVDVRVVCMC